MTSTDDANSIRRDLWIQRLTEPLPGNYGLDMYRDEERMRASVGAWMYEKWEEFAYTISYHSLFNDKETLDSAVREMFFLMCDQLYCWPLPYQGRQLGMVIRQWAEDEPSSTLANQLSESDSWKKEIAGFHEQFILFRATRPNYSEHQWVQGLGYHLKGPEMSADEGATRYISARLRLRGLPNTPCTVRHFRAVVAGLREPLPTRGVLVTTLVYVNTKPRPGEEPLGAAPFVRFIEPPHETIITGATEWMPGSLLKGANQVVRKHEEWLHAHRDYPITEIATIRRSQETAFSAKEMKGKEWFDYYAEAISDGSIKWIQRNTPSLGRQTAISKRLSDVKRNIDKRHQRAGRPIPPSNEWRERARRYIHIQLP